MGLRIQGISDACAIHTGEAGGSAQHLGQQSSRFTAHRPA